MAAAASAPITTCNVTTDNIVDTPTDVEPAPIESSSRFGPLITRIRASPHGNGLLEEFATSPDGGELGFLQDLLLDLNTADADQLFHVLTQFSTAQHAADLERRPDLRLVVRSTTDRYFPDLADLWLPVNTPWRADTQDLYFEHARPVRVQFGAYTQSNPLPFPIAVDWEACSNKSHHAYAEWRIVESELRELVRHSDEFGHKRYALQTFRRALNVVGAAASPDAARSVIRACAQIVEVEDLHNSNKADWLAVHAMLDALRDSKALLTTRLVEDLFQHLDQGEGVLIAERAGTIQMMLQSFGEWATTTTFEQYVRIRELAVVRYDDGDEVLETLHGIVQIISVRPTEWRDDSKMRAVLAFLEDAFQLDEDWHPPKTLLSLFKRFTPKTIDCFLEAYSKGDSSLSTLERFLSWVNYLDYLSPGCSVATNEILPELVEWKREFTSWDRNHLEVLPQWSRTVDCENVGELLLPFLAVGDEAFCFISTRLREGVRLERERRGSGQNVLVTTVSLLEGHSPVATPHALLGAVDIALAFANHPHYENDVAHELCNFASWRTVSSFGCSPLPDGAVLALIRIGRRAAFSTDSQKRILKMCSNDHLTEKLTNKLIVRFGELASNDCVDDSVLRRTLSNLEARVQQARSVDQVRDAVRRWLMVSDERWMGEPGWWERIWGGVLRWD